VPREKKRTIATVLQGFMQLMWLDVVDFGWKWKVQTGAG